MSELDEMLACMDLGGGANARIKRLFTSGPEKKGKEGGGKGGKEEKKGGRGGKGGKAGKDSEKGKAAPPAGLAKTKCPGCGVKSVITKKNPCQTCKKKFGK